MKSPIKLTRRLAVDGWHVTGEVALSRKREVEPLVLMEAVARATITPRQIADALLDGRLAVAQRLVEACAQLGLLVREGEQWRPTDAGRLAAATGRVLVPERGAWTVWVAQDALLASPVLGVTPWKEPSAQDERKARSGRGEKPARSFRALPAWLLEQQRRVIVPLGGTAEELRLDALGPKGERAQGVHDLRITLTLTPESARLQAHGVLDGGRVERDLSTDRRDYDKTLAELLAAGGAKDRWDAHRRALWVRFDEVDDRERASLRRTLHVAAPALAGLGAFDATRLEDLPLRPWSKSDGDRWAEWRLLEALNGYPTDAELDAGWSSASEPFEEMVSKRRSRAAMAAELRGAARPPPKYWQLQVPSDWGLEVGGER